MLEKLKIKKVTMSGDFLEDVEVSPVVFGHTARRDIVHRVVQWQMAKRRSGNHKTKGIGDISGTTKKPHKQKGTGRARLGSARAPQCRGGATIFGPVVRSHAFSLPKKIRRQGLQSALSSLLREGRVSIVEKASIASPKTKEVRKAWDGSVLIVSGESVCENLRKALSNAPYLNVLPQGGVNVLDLIRHDRVLLSQEALRYLESFLSPRRKSL
jgi:large subunit ribosomal protein L4